MNIISCFCEKENPRDDDYINYDIITFCNDLLIDTLPQDLIDLIFKFIIDYLTDRTASYGSKFLKNNYNCAFKHMVGLCDATMKEHNYNNPRCSIENSVNYLIKGIPDCEHSPQDRTMICDLVHITSDVVFPDDEYHYLQLIPLDFLIESNNVLAHYYALLKYPLSSDDLANIFRRWFTSTMIICSSHYTSSYTGSTIKYYRCPYPFSRIGHSQHEISNIILTELLKTMYDKYNINALYNVVEELIEEKIDPLPIIEHFQLPPPILEKIIKFSRVGIVSDIMKWQIYIDDSIILNNLNDLTTVDIKHIVKDKRLDLSVKLVNIILHKYPTLLPDIIINNHATIDIICERKQYISEECWQYISAEYNIPKDKINMLYKYLDWKTLISHNPNHKFSAKRDKKEIIDNYMSEKFMLDIEDGLDDEILNKLGTDFGIEY